MLQSKRAKYYIDSLIVMPHIFENIINWKFWAMGHAATKVVRVLTFYSDDLSLNPTEAYSFFAKICVWKEQKYAKRGWGQLFKMMGQNWVGEIFFRCYKSSNYFSSHLNYKIEDEQLRINVGPVIERQLSIRKYLDLENI